MMQDRYAGQTMNPASETLSMTISLQMSALSNALDRIESSTAMICGGGYGEAKAPGPTAVLSGLHPQWADGMAALVNRANRIADTLSTI